MDDKTDSHHDKKIKLQGEYISKSQDGKDAANKMKLESDKEIPKSHDGADTVNFEDPRPRKVHIIYVSYEVGSYLLSSGEDPNSLFDGMIEEAGCRSTQIRNRSIMPFYFFAELTTEEAEKVSRLDSVGKVRHFVDRLLVRDD